MEYVIQYFYDSSSLLNGMSWNSYAVVPTMKISNNHTVYIYILIAIGEQVIYYSTAETKITLVLFVTITHFRSLCNSDVQTIFIKNIFQQCFVKFECKIGVSRTKTMRYMKPIYSVTQFE